MSLTYKKFEALSVGDFDSALENKLPESRMLDYKRDLPAFSDDGKRELLADVSAMANTLGGLLIYGIEEEVDSGGRNAGVPRQSVFGVVIHNEDDLKLKLHSVIRDGLNPRLPGVEIGIFVVQGKTVLVISIPKSLYSPHAVWLGKSGKFFRRNDSGKYQVDPAELREMFNVASLWLSQVGEFRAERMRRIASNDVLSNLDGSRYALLHVLPYGRLTESVDIFSPNILEAQGAVRATSPFPNSLNDFSTNFDGLMCFQTRNPPNKPERYSQAFAFGGIEHFASDIFGLDGADSVVDGLAVQAIITNGVPMTVKQMEKRWGIGAPYAVLLTLVGARRMHAMMRTQFYGAQRSGNVMTLDNAMFPPLIVESSTPTEAEVTTLIRQFWRAFGEEFPLTHY